MSFRLNSAVYDALKACAAASGYETMAYIQRILSKHAVESGYMSPADATKAESYDELFELAVKKARALFEQGLFDQDWTLTVFRHLMADAVFRPKYERTIGGDAYDAGLPGKTPLNMYLGWYVKNAIPAEPLTASDGKPVRVQVKNEPIQSYTRLRLASGHDWPQRAAPQDALPAQR
jgi:hypothetical protein